MSTLGPLNSIKMNNNTGNLHSDISLHSSSTIANYTRKVSAMKNHIFSRLHARTQQRLLELKFRLCTTKELTKSIEKISLELDLARVEFADPKVPAKSCKTFTNTHTRSRDDYSWKSHTRLIPSSGATELEWVERGQQQNNREHRVNTCRFSTRLSRNVHLREIYIGDNNSGSRVGQRNILRGTGHAIRWTSEASPLSTWLSQKPHEDDTMNGMIPTRK